MKIEQLVIAAKHLFGSPSKK